MRKRDARRRALDARSETAPREGPNAAFGATVEERAAGRDMIFPFMPPTP